MPSDLMRLTLWIISAMFMFLMLYTGCNSDKDMLLEGFDLQGHRGARGLMPENTLPAFYAAVDYGVNTIEFDLVVTSEHQLVISHEPWFRSDICLQPDGSPIPKEEERSFRIYEYSYVEIAEFDCGSLQHPDFPGQRTLFASKPLMIDAIVAIDEYAHAAGRRSVRYNIEIKTKTAWDGSLTPPPDVFARLLYEELMEMEEVMSHPIMERITVQSFDPRSLHVFRELAPTVPLALLTSVDATVDEHIKHFGFIPEIYSTNYGILTKEHVKQAHQLGMRVIPWTVNQIDEMKAMVELGVDGLITDYPDRFNEAFPGRSRVSASR